MARALRSPAGVGRPGTQAETANGGVVRLLLPGAMTPNRPVPSNQAMSPVATWLSMIVEITTLTPRRTCSQPAIAAHAAPTASATPTTIASWRAAGRATAAPTTAAAKAARRYCPSIPMLNRRRWNPIAAANPARA